MRLTENGHLTLDLVGELVLDQVLFVVREVVANRVASLSFGLALEFLSRQQTISIVVVGIKHSLGPRLSEKLRSGPLL